MPSKRNLWDGFAISRQLETFLRRLWFSIFPLFIEKPPWKLENIFFQKFDSKICINETHRGKFKFPKRKGNNETLRTKRSNFDHFYHFTQLCSSFLFLISLSRGKRIHLFFKPRIEREGREKKHNLISPRTWILKKIKIPKEKGRVYYPKNKYRALEISKQKGGAKSGKEKGTIPIMWNSSPYVERSMSRRGTRHRLVDAWAGGGWGGREVVGGRGPVDTAESPERGEPRENSHGWKYKSFFVLLLLLSLASFLRLPRFIRGCNLELGFYGARSNVLLSFPPLSAFISRFFLSSFFLRER